MMMVFLLIILFLFIIQQDGKRYYKVKWVRFTWELEETISIKLKDLLDTFWEEHGGDPNTKEEKPLITTDTSFSTISKQIKVCSLFHVFMLSLFSLFAIIIARKMITKILG